MSPEASWMSEQMKSRRFRWGFRWGLLKDRLHYWLWMWPTDGLVWDFDAFEQLDEFGNRVCDPRLKHCRSGFFLDANDPRHFDEIEDDPPTPTPPREEE